MRRSLLLALLALLAAGCAHQPRPASPIPDPAGPPGATTPGQPGADPAARPLAPGAAPATSATDPLADVRAGVDALLTAQGEAAWRAWTGGDPADPADAWAGREWLASPATLARLADALAAAPATERAGLDRLRAFVLGEHLARAAAGPARALAAARAAATFRWDRRSVPLRQLPALLAAEPEGPRRQALAAAHAAEASKLAPLVASRDAALAAAGGTAGFTSTLELAAALRGAPAAELAALAEATLAGTEATWRALLADLSRRELGGPAERLRARDLPRLLRTTAPPAAFPAARLLPDAEQLLIGLGLDLAAGGRLTVDAAPRPGKIARPLAVVVEAPGAVRLSLAPLAGLDAARALLHELGVAQAAARTTAAAVEDRRLGPAALPAAWGALLASVTASPDWLSAHGLEPAAVARQARVAAARRLLSAREAAARVLAEVERARDPAGAPAVARALASRALGLPLGPGEPLPWAFDQEPLLRAAETLQAELLAAQVEAFLAAPHGGGPWWRSRQSGAWLAQAWAVGARRSPQEVARGLGAAGLDPAALDALARAAAGPPAAPAAP
ncbi:MAG: hypothetical protein IPQ24_06220 [Anaeromyxobacter sp.]|nr:hypothetical protein [Anaeromyxobacter sp.]